MDHARKSQGYPCRLLDDEFMKLLELWWDRIPDTFQTTMCRGVTCRLLVRLAPIWRALSSDFYC
jgi:hypothetical protein